ncbi:replication initiation protein RepC [Rhizobium leguminosarum]|uniref:Replication initiation protein RepC n=1 Tax=Rhizobium leguminosarum TaxID=384 RepID=A0AAE2MPQ9_RHILE|nr:MULTISPECIES: plasmid replication protein RepC [Rhizobium]ARM91035.1 replication initiation protein RepC 2 [Rhizobium sp. CIAT894]MBB4293703.1 replication initiation protein RepC [Rhizobium leguminosarum]MBB4299303.1 replication initiation protein RepC [Rhizobium leguminosarum]MBB4310802.1 replication initiation protein RepC [Rhizobium leguminosarum]MBB4420086.1 replication initiation protein RepC [Rhizobium leguminosarum]
MQTGHVTTPFGRRPMSLALVKGQMAIADSSPGARIEKWKVFRDVCEARERFGLQDRALAVLDALLTFYPNGELDAEHGLVVFPSNAQLSVRAHGITETTLRRQLGALVDAGLIQRRDSPNGKRYAHRNRDGEIEQAYGFDLTPLLARAKELAMLAQDVAAERMRFRRAKEALTICRRDVRKLISAAIEEGASGNWGKVETAYIGILARLPRYPGRTQVEAALDEMELLREEVLNILEIQLNTDNLKGNAIQNDRHIQNSNTESINEFEPCTGKAQGENLAEQPHPKSVTPRDTKAKLEQIRAFPLGMVLRACPQITDYGPVGGISNWRELMAAAVVVRSMLGVSPSAYEEACNAMGPENAAAAMACILERSNFINSAGGYLRDLTKRSDRGEFSLGPMLMSLLKANDQGYRKVS